MNRHTKVPSKTNLAPYKKVYKLQLNGIYFWNAYSLGCPGTRSVGQAVLERTEYHQLPPPEIKGMSHHCPALE